MLITGPNEVAQMKEKIGLARSFEAINEAQHQTLINKVADIAGTRVELRVSQNIPGLPPS